MVKSSFFSILSLLSLLMVIGFSQKVEAVGVINLPLTGQTVSYAAGDDGAIRAGVVWPATRFVENSTGALNDNLTGLIWAKDAGTPTFSTCGGGTKTWQGALEYVACLNSVSFLGSGDWRLPTILELSSLFNDGQANSATWLTGQGFSNVQTSPLYYWSSTTYAGSTGYAWNANLRDARPEYAGSKSGSSFYVLPVRGTTADPARLRRSGQIMSYADGDDGQLQTGVAWPATRFTSDASGQCLTDGLTGLTWVRYPLPTLRSWQGALEYANHLNLCGASDWRLPNRQELRSLVDYGATSPADSLNAIAFGGIRSREYWSSTSYAPGTGNAWHLNLGNGYEYTVPGKTGNLSTLAVRSGAIPTPTGQTLSGSVTSGGVGLAGATVTLSGARSAVSHTDSSGQFVFADLPDGSYTLTPSRTNYSFTPAQLPVTMSGSTLSGRNFTASLAPYGWIDMGDNLSGLAGKATLGAMSWVSADEGWIASGIAGEIYYTFDGGRTFTTQTIPNSTPINVMQMLNASEGYAGGNSRLYRTTNGGNSWSYIGSCGNVRALSFAPGSATGFCGSDNGSILSITGNALMSMNKLTSNSIPGISAVAANRVWAVWWQSVLFYNGSSWVDQESSFDSNLPISLQNIHMVNDQIGWVVGAYGLIAKTTTGGEVVNDMTPWTGQTNPDPTQRALNDVFFLNSSEGWTVGNGGVILHTSNGGTTWGLEAEGMTANMLRSVRFTSAGNGYVLGNNATLLKYAPLPQKPTVTTSPLSDVTTTGAMGGGNVISDGEGAVSSKGICWNTSANPTTANNRTSDGTGPGHFTSALIDLAPYTTYHVRAYATNEGGTAYGDDLYFTTPCPSYVAKTGTTGYASLQEAIDTAAGATEIRVVAKELTEVVSITGSKTITLLGGYDCVCSSVTGMTTVHGSLTIGGSAAVNIAHVGFF
ncbi:MAG: DUF2012 domain-containing protein [Desulfuromonadales bacterium]|nr:DUF2012 domain-containing protein [Desulfuromonadales bacterium]